MIEPTVGLPALFAVLGDPIAHSRSPAMHNAAFAQLGLSHRYVPLHVRAEQLADALKGVGALGFGGVNLTVPHKRQALSIVDELTPTAARIGAVNTVIVRQRTGGPYLVGDNTDSPGFAAAVRELGPRPVERALVLGSGGASRAIVDALVYELRCTHLCWVTRQPQQLSVEGLGGATQVEVVDYHALTTKLGFDLLVNTTTVGMHGGPTAFPAAVEPQVLCPGGRVVDIVYPRPAGGLLDRAEATGCQVQDGLPMLLWQGVLALQRWLGRELPTSAIEAMRRAIENA